MSFTIGISPERTKSGILSPSHLPKKERHFPSIPRKAHSLPTYLDHPQSWNLGSSPSSGQPIDTQRKIRTFSGPTLYTVIFIARYHLIPKSEKRLRSKPRLQVTALFLIIFYGLLNVHGRAFAEWAERLTAQNYPITTSSSCIGPRHDSSSLPSHSVLLVHSPYPSDAEKEVFLLLLVVTFLVFRESTLRHFGNDAVAIGHNITINQGVGPSKRRTFYIRRRSRIRKVRIQLSQRRRLQS